MTPVALELVLLGGVLRVVDQQVDAVAQLEHLLGHEVVGVVAVPGPWSEMYATDTPFDVDPEPERRVDVADPTRPHLGAVTGSRRRRRVERDVAAQLVGPDREVGRAHQPA